MADYGELGQLLRNRAPQRNYGASELGAMLGGGGAMRQQQLYNMGALSGARLTDVMAQARGRQQAEVRAQAQDSARHDLAEQSRAKGDNEMASVIDAAHEINPNTYFEGAGRQQHNTQQAELFKRAHDPGVNLGQLNNELATLEGKPMTTQDIKDNTVYNPHGSPGDPVNTNDIGRAIIGTQGALAGEHNAQAGAANALRDQRRGGGGGGSAKPAPLTSAAAKIFNIPVNDESGAPKMDSQGRPVFRTDVDKMKDFQRFIGERSGSDPALLNQNVALPKYLNAFGQQNNAQPPGSFTNQDVGQDDVAQPDLVSTIQSKLQSMDAPPAIAAQAAAQAAPQIAAKAAPAIAAKGAGRKIVRTGSLNGARVVQYDDGSVEPAGQ